MIVSKKVVNESLLASKIILKHKEEHISIGSVVACVNNQQSSIELRKHSRGDEPAGITTHQQNKMKSFMWIVAGETLKSTTSSSEKQLERARKDSTESSIATLKIIEKVNTKVIRQCSDTYQLDKKSEEIFPCFCVRFEVPADCMTLFQWCQSQRELTLSEALLPSQIYRLALNLAQSIIALHKESRGSNFTDLSIEESIFVDSKGEIKLLCFENKHSPETVETFIIEKNHVESLRKEQLCNYPPELIEYYLKASLHANTQKPAQQQDRSTNIRRDKADVWAFGVALISITKNQQILKSTILGGCEEWEKDNIGFNFRDSSQLSLSNDLFNNLLKGVFERDPKSRMTLSAVKTLLEEMIVTARREEIEWFKKQRKFLSLLTVEDELKLKDHIHLQNWDEATALLQTISDKEKDDGLALLLMGQLFIAQSKTSLAIAKLKQIEKIDEVGSELLSCSLFELGRLTFNRKEFSESQKYLKKSHSLITSSSNYSQANVLFYLAEIDSFNKDYAAAVILLRELVLLEPYNPLFQIKLAYALKKELKIQESYSVLQSIPQVRYFYTTEFEALERSVIQMILKDSSLEQLKSARLKFKINETSDSISEYTLIIEKDKESLPAIIGLCECLIKSGSSQSAIESLEKISEKVLSGVSDVLIREELMIRHSLALARAYKLEQQARKSLQWFFKTLQLIRKYTILQPEMKLVLLTTLPEVRAETFETLTSFIKNFANVPQETDKRSDKRETMPQFKIEQTSKIANSIKFSFTESISSVNIDTLYLAAIQSIDNKTEYEVCLLRFFQKQLLQDIAEDHGKKSLIILRTAQTIFPSNILSFDACSLDLCFKKSQSKAQDYLRKMLKPKGSELVKEGDSITTESSPTKTETTSAIAEISDQQYLSPKDKRLLKIIQEKMDLQNKRATLHLTDSLKKLGLYNLALVDFLKDKGYSSARIFQYLQESLQFDDKDADIWCLAGKVFFKLNLIESANDCIEQALSIQKYHVNSKKSLYQYAKQNGHVGFEEKRVAWLQAKFIQNYIESIISGDFHNLEKDLDTDEIMDGNDPTFEELLVKLLKVLSDRSACESLSQVVKKNYHGMKQQKVLDIIIEEVSLLFSVQTSKEQDEKNARIKKQVDIKKRLFGSYIEQTDCEIVQLLSESKISLDGELSYSNVLQQIKEREKVSSTVVGKLLMSNLLSSDMSVGNYENALAALAGCESSEGFKGNLKLNVLLRRANFHILLGDFVSAKASLVAAKREFETLAHDKATKEGLPSIQFALLDAFMEINEPIFGLQSIENPSPSDEAITIKVRNFAELIIYINTQKKSIDESIQQAQMMATSSLSRHLPKSGYLYKRVLCIQGRGGHQKEGKLSCFGFCHYLSAQESYKQRKFKKAEEQIQKAIDFNLNNIPFLLKASRIYLEQELFQAAIKIFQQVLAIDPGNFTALVESGKRQVIDGHLEEAFVSFYSVITDTPRRDYLSVFSPSTSSEEIKSAIKPFIEEVKKVLKDNYRSGQHILEVITLFIQVLEKLESDSAIEIYNTFLKVSPDNLSLKINLGRLYFKLNNFSLTKNTLEPILNELSKGNMINTNGLDKVKQSEAYTILGLINKQEKEYDVAIKHFSYATKVRSQHESAYYQIGKCIMLKNKSPTIEELKKAEESFEQQIAITPKDFESLLELGKLQVSLQKLPQAAQTFNLAQNACHNNPEIKEKLFNKIVDIYMLKEMYPKAIKTLQNQLKDFPDQSYFILRRIAGIYRRNLSKTKEACQVLEECLAFSSDKYADVAYQLANIYDQDNGDQAKALHWSIQAINFDDSLCEGHIKIANIHLKIYEQNPSDLPDAQEHLLSSQKHLTIGLLLNPTHWIGLFLQGSLYFFQKQFAKAIEFFSLYLEQAISTKCKEEVYGFLGIAYKKLKLYQFAEPCFTVRTSLKFNIQNTLEHISCLQKMNRYDESGEVLMLIDKNLVHNSSLLSRMYYLFGKQEKHAGEVGKSTTAFRASIIVLSGCYQYSIKSLDNLLLIVLHSHSLTSDFAYITHALQENHLESAKSKALAYCMLGEIYIQNQDYQKAAQNFASAESHSKEKLKVRIALGIIKTRFRSNEIDFSQAVSDILKIGSFSNYDGRWLTTYFEALAGAKEFKKIILYKENIPIDTLKAFDKEIQDELTYYFCLSIVRDECGIDSMEIPKNLDDSARVVKMLKTSKQFFPCAFLRGKILFAQGEVVESMKCFQEAVFRNKQHLPSYIYLAQNAAEKDLIDLSISYYCKIIAISQVQAHYVALAQQYMKKKDKHIEALSIAKKAIALAPEEPIAYLITAQALFVEKEFVQSREHIEKYFEMQSTPCIDGQLLLGKLNVVQERPEEAKEVFRSIIQRCPQHLNAYIQLGDLYLQRKELESLKNLYDESFQIIKDAGNFHSIGEWALELDNLDEAEVYLYEAVFKKAKGREKADSERDVMNLMRLYLKKGKMDKLDDLFSFDLEISTSPLIGILVNVCDAFLEQRLFKNCVKWSERSKKFIGEVKSSFKLDIILATSLFALRNYAESVKALESSDKSFLMYNKGPLQVQVTYLRSQLNRVFETGKIVSDIKENKLLAKVLKSDGSTPLITAALGFLFLKAKQFKKIKEMINELSEEDKKKEQVMSLTALVMLGEAATLESSSSIAQKEEAILKLEETIKIHPNSEVALQNLGLIYFEASKYEQAERVLKELFKVVSKPMECQFIRAIDQTEIESSRLILAKIYEKLKKNEECEAIVKVILAKNPNNFQAQLLGSLSNYRLSRYPAALLYLNTITPSTLLDLKQSFDYHLITAKIRIGMDQFDKATQALKKCLSSFPKDIDAQLLMAQCSERVSNISGALEQLMSVYSQDRTSITVALRIVKILFTLGKLKELENFLNDTSNPGILEDFEIAYMKGRLLYKQGKIKPAIAFTQQFIDQVNVKQLVDDKIVPFLRLLDFITELYQEHKNRIEAIAAYRTIIDLNLTHQQLIKNELYNNSSVQIASLSRIYFHLANALIAQKDFREALRVLVAKTEGSDPSQESVGLYPNEALFHSKIQTLTSSAICHLAVGNNVQALLALQKANAKSKHEEQVHFLLGFTYTRVKDYSSAIASYIRCLELEPAFLPAAVNLAKLYRKANQAGEAVNILSKMTVIFPKHIQPQYEIALTYYLSKSPAQAVYTLLPLIPNLAELIQQSSEINPKYSVQFQKTFDEFTMKEHPHLEDRRTVDELLAYNREFLCFPDAVSVNILLAASMRKSKQIQDSIKHLESCINQNPDNRHYSYSLALSHYAQGDLESMVYEINRCKELQPDLAPAYSFALANILHHKRSYGEEIKLLLNCARADPEWCEVHTNLGCAYMKTGEILKAIRSFEQAARLADNTPNVYFNLANAYIKADRIESAKETYKKCIEIDPLNVQAFYNLALIYQRQRLNQEAVDCFYKCFEINPYDKDDYLPKIDKLSKLIYLGS